MLLPNHRLHHEENPRIAAPLRACCRDCFVARGACGRANAVVHIRLERWTCEMPEVETLRRARRDRAEGKAPSTQAGEFVREEIHHVREGKHGARSTAQAIAIGLSKARRAGVRIPAKGKSAKKRAASTRPRSRPPSPKRSRALRRALKRAPRRVASHDALSRFARKAAHRRTPSTKGRRAQSSSHQETHDPLIHPHRRTVTWQPRSGREGRDTAKPQASAWPAQCAGGNVERSRADQAARAAR
jgi:Family of unknown function (DUF6496)